MPLHFPGDSLLYVPGCAPERQCAWIIPTRYCRDAVIYDEDTLMLIKHELIACFTGRKSLRENILPEACAMSSRTTIETKRKIATNSRLLQGI